MNRIRISNNTEKFENEQLERVKESLKITQNAHSSNEQILEKLFKDIRNEQQQHLRNALQKDMKLINDQLKKISNNFNEK